MEVQSIINKLFSKALAESGAAIPEKFTDNLILLESGLDSLGFAILVARLEIELGYDPFTLMKDPVYPTTYSEFVDIYKRFKDYT